VKQQTPEKSTPRQLGLDLRENRAPLPYQTQLRNLRAAGTMTGRRLDRTRAHLATLRRTRADTAAIEKVERSAAKLVAALERLNKEALALSAQRGEGPK
jgi:hypothetical protein